MGLFSKRVAKQSASQRPRLVSVNFRELGNIKRPHPGSGYVYIWTLSQEPSVGTWVWVPGADGLTTAMVCDAKANLPARLSFADLSTVAGLVDARQVETADRKAQHGKAKWMSAVRLEASFPSLRRPSAANAQGLVVYPAAGDAAPREAAQYGNAWWKLFKQGTDAGWTEADLERFSSIARRWYAIRDRR